MNYAKQAYCEIYIEPDLPVLVDISMNEAGDQEPVELLVSRRVAISQSLRSKSKLIEMVQASNMPTVSVVFYSTHIYYFGENLCHKHRS